MRIRSPLVLVTLAVVQLLISADARAQALGRSFDGGILPVGHTEIFVADTVHHRLVRVNDMTGAGWTTLGGPDAGSGNGQFNQPTGVFAQGGLVAALGSSHIYVADKMNLRVVQVDNMNGDGWTNLSMPGGRRPLRVASNGALYVTIDPNLLLRYASVGDPNPAVLQGSTVRTALTPSGIGWASGGGGLYLGANQSLFLAATQYAVRINGWPANNPTPVGDACCVDGQGALALNQPHGITVDRLGRIYVADTGNNRVVRFDNVYGDGLTALGGPAAGTGVDRFNHPTAVTVHNNQIYVADADNNRIVRFDDMVDSGGVSSSVGWVSLAGITCRATLPGLPLPFDPPTVSFPIKQRFCDTFARPQDLSVITTR